jgi:RNA polymerase sigma factor (sigma-70 family)
MEEHPMKDEVTERGLSDGQAAALAVVEQDETKFVSQAARILRDRQAASDVIQELRLEILQSHSLPQEAHELKPYLTTMLTNVAYRWRSKNLDPRMEHCQCPEEHLKLIEEQLRQPASAEDDFGSVDVGFRSAFLRRRAEEMPVRRAEVFTKVSAGATHEKVATDMGIKLTSVKSHWRRALKKLRGKTFPGGKS